MAGGVPAGLDYHSFGVVEKATIVLDLGSRFTKCGFAGEGAPRHMYPSPLFRQDAADPHRLPSLHVVRAPEEWMRAVEDHLHVVFFQKLQANPKERRVLVCDNLLAATAFREAVARVLFERLQVPSVVFAPLTALALYTITKSTGIVLDCGNAETQVLPIYEGTPLIHALRYVPLGGHAIERRLRSLLGESGIALSDATVEDVKVRACFVRGRNETGANVGTVKFLIDAKTSLSVSGDVRCRAADVLFEGDEERESIASCLAESISKCAPDVRNTVVRCIILCGGSAMLPGFQARLEEELNVTLETSDYSHLQGLRERIRFISPPFPPNCTTWVGGSILASLDTSGISLSRENYLESPVLPEWSCLRGEANDVPQK